MRWRVEIGDYAVFKHGLYLLSGQDAEPPLWRDEEPVSTTLFVSVYKADLMISTRLDTGYLKRFVVTSETTDGDWEDEVRAEIQVENTLWLFGDMDQARVPVFTASTPGAHRLRVLSRQRGDEENEEYEIQISPS